MSADQERGEDAERALPFLSEAGEPLVLSVVNARQKPIRWRLGLRRGGRWGHGRASS